MVTAARHGPGSGSGASVSLISNGGLNDAIGGATSGTLNLTQTAIGGSGGSLALVAMQQAYLLELTPSEPQPIILLPMQLAGMHAGFGAGGSATATADARASNSGIANATANATGGSGGGSMASEARPPQTLAQPMEDRQLLKRLAANLRLREAQAKRKRYIYRNGGSAVAQATGGGNQPSRHTANAAQPQLTRLR